jgi:hypothetical protein
MFEKIRNDPNVIFKGWRVDDSCEKPLSKILSASVSVNNYHNAVPAALWKVSSLKDIAKKVLNFVILFRLYVLFSAPS